MFIYHLFIYLLSISLDIPCPADIIIAVDMCTCDPKRFEQAQNFIISLAERLLPESFNKTQKIRFSVIQVS